MGATAKTATEAARTALANSGWNWGQFRGETEERLKEGVYAFGADVRELAARVCLDRAGRADDGRAKTELEIAAQEIRALQIRE